MNPEYQTDRETLTLDQLNDVSAGVGPAHSSSVASDLREIGKGFGQIGLGIYESTERARTSFATGFEQGYTGRR